MVRWKLREYLHDHGLSVYKLTQAASGQLSANGIYKLARGTTTVQLETLSVLIETLQTLTGQPVSVADLLEYHPAGNIAERESQQRRR